MPLVSNVETRLLHGFVARDANPAIMPAKKAKGKIIGKSLLQLQDLAGRLLLAEDYQWLMKCAHKGVKANCGDPWLKDVVEQAKKAGPHVSALRPKGAALTWEDIQYQVDAGFVKIVTKEELFTKGPPKQLKMSQVAMVPQQNQRDRIILNLLTEVAEGKSSWRS